MLDDTVDRDADNTAYPDRAIPVFPVLENRADRGTDTWQIADGVTVYATDGEKVGTVRNYNPQAGYLDIKKGWLFTKDVYVPLDRVDAATEDGGITLKVTKDELADDRYSSPPTPSAAKLEPVVLTDGTVVGTGETTKGTPSDDPVFERSTGTSLTDVPDREGRPVG